MTHTEVLKLVLDALEDRTSLMKWQKARDAVKEALAKQEHGDPLDMPLPCDVKVGHVNIRKGVALRILCARMQVLYEMAQSKQEQGEPVAIIHRNEYNEYRLEPHDNFDIKSIPFNVDVSLYTTPQPQEFVCGTGLCRFNLTQTNVGIGERGMEAYEAAKERGWVGVSDERLMEMPKQEQGEPVAWAEEIIDDFYALYNSEMIKENNSGDELIRLDAAICVVEEAAQRHTTPPQQRTWVELTDDEQISLLKESDGKTRHWLVWQVEAKLKQNNGYNT